MATQTVEFLAPSGLTVTAKLFPAGSDTQVDSESATEATNRKGTYTASYTDLSAGTYRLIAMNASNVPLAAWWITTTGATETVQAYEMSVETIQSGLATAAKQDQIIAATEAPLLLQTTIATVTSQTQFTLTDGLATADVYNGLLLSIVDTDTPSTNRARVKVDDYDGATKTVYLETAPSYTIAVGDAVTVFAAKEFDATGVTISSFEQAALNQLANTDVEIIGIVSAGGGLQLIQGDDYVDDELTFTQTSSENWPDLDDEDTKVTFSAIKQGEDESGDNTIYVEGEVVTPTGSSKQVTFDLSHALNNKDAGTYSYHIRAWILNGAGDDWIKRTLRRGQDKMAIVAEYQADEPDVPTP